MQHSVISHIAVLLAVYKSRLKNIKRIYGQLNCKVLRIVNYSFFDKMSHKSIPWVARKIPET